MLRATWKAGSLRFWVLVGMALTLVPLLVAAVLGYFILHRGIVEDFQDVAMRQRDQIIPAHRLQLDLQKTTEPILLYLNDSDPAEAAAYRALRERIEGEFARLHEALTLEPEPRTLVERSRSDWTEADHAAGEILSRRWPPGSTNGIDLAKRFDAAIAASTDKLTAVHEDLDRDLDADHRDAERSFERSEWVAGIAAGVSLAFMGIGVFVIGRFLVASVDRLVEGAARFAAGDREHRIEVQVPPELNRVAEEFNQMILRIRESEDALADLARRDRLTGLLNRRALEEALADALGRRKRLNEDVSVLLLDVDHFKRVNDTHGHPAGDEVLRRVAKMLVAGVREIDKPFRFGGEECVVLLHDANETAALATAERLRGLIAERPVATGDANIPVTISIGVAVARQSTDGEALLAAADTALYQAKHAGRNRVVVADNG